MMIWEGKGIADGIAIGSIAIFHKKEIHVKCSRISDTEAEKERFLTAKKTARAQLTELYTEAAEKVGQENAFVFEAQKLLLEDPEYLESITAMIETRSVNAEFAVAAARDEFARRFSSLKDDYMKERAADIRDVSDRVIRILQESESGSLYLEKPVILLADELSPSEIVRLDQSKILAFVTRHGSSNSHTAILARTMNIPALTCVDFPEDLHGKTGIADGTHGVLYIEPDERELEEFRELKAQEEKKEQRLLELKGKKDVTKDGTEIRLYANVGRTEDVAAALVNDAGGIGLYRSEFLYLEAKDYPSEEVQFAAYRAVAEAMRGKEVIIRTLDIGADKQADYFHLEKEENPAMGYRGIRICLDRTEIFKTQLRAIYRAGCYGKIAMMFPMIISVEEVRKIRKIISEVKTELQQAGVPYREIELGIMIETPAAVMISDLLAKEVDFFSIGTNDLTQYTLAMDRQNSGLETMYDPHHEAILRMIRMVVDNGHAAGCRVGICGELAADLTLTETFLRMGVDELSVSPSGILPVREKIRSIHLTSFPVT